MSAIDDLSTPALLLDLDVLDNNLDHMAKRTESLGVRLRPHVKTHKCPEIAERQRRRGAAGLTVSTLYEAAVFADHGFDDITWAFPLILSRIDDALALAARIDLGLLIDSRTALDALRAKHAGPRPLRIWLKVDCGYHRAGVDPESEEAVELPRAIEADPNLTFAGVLTHSGHAYHAADRAEMIRIAEQERRVMADVGERIRAAGVDVPQASVGSTPAMSVVESLEGITEARPGNYAFYDYMQCALGSCGPQDCAVSVLSSVVSEMRDHSVVDAGALAMSADPGPDIARHRQSPDARRDTPPHHAQPLVFGDGVLRRIPGGPGWQDR